jgi:hypothetical protein
LQFVSDQELQRAVKADVRQCRAVRPLMLELRRPKAQETKIGFFGVCA